ncbi:MAG: C40 family peptidase, partial [Clostridia bacterium]|nr:C40 family peptidase [Clostridia bacterium]
MKKFLSTFILAILMLGIAFAFAACGDETPPPTPEPTPEECTHSFSGEWEVIKKATKKVDGKEENTCTLCQEKVTRVIPKIIIAEIKAAQMPKTTSYFTNEKFNPLGLIIEAVYTDGSKTIVTDYSHDKTEPLTANDTTVTVTYETYTLQIPITVSSAIRAKVSDISKHNAGTLIYVEGYCVGYFIGANNTKNYLIKDKNTEDLITLSGVPYAEGYSSGDNLAFYANVAVENGTKSIVFAESNADKATTVVSTGHYPLYYFDKAVTVNDSADLSALFANGAPAANTYVKIKGNFFIYRYGAEYRIHMNSAAEDENGMKLSDKFIRIADQNLEGTWLESKVHMTGSDEMPGLWVAGEFNGVYTGEDSESFNLTVLRTDWVSVSLYAPNHDYVIEMAYAYKNQGYQVDYDQYNTRRNVNISPEDATAYRRIFLDCSSYVNSVYYNAFGVNVLPYSVTEKGATTKNFDAYAMENQNAIDVYAYYENKNLSKEQKQEILDELKKGLMVGDVIVYRKTSGTGHALIYVGNGNILHCANSGSYEENLTNPLESYDQLGNGDILTETVRNLFETPTATRYLLSDSYTSFCILRPLNRNLTPTEQMQKRMTIPSLSIEKAVSTNMYTSVFTGSTLTYTVILENKGTSKLTGVTVNEFIPNGTTFLSATDGVTVDGENVTWTGDVDAGATVQISFTVTVTSTQKGLVISSELGNVNGLLLNKITNTVSGISEEKINELKAKAKEYISESKQFSDPILAAKQLYKDVFGVDIFDYESVEAALLDIIDITARGCNPDSDVADMVIEDLSGGYLVKASNVTNNDRIRAIRKDYLSAGDVIMAKYVNSANETCTVLYVYLGGGEFLQINNTDG